MCWVNRDWPAHVQHGTSTITHSYNITWAVCVDIVRSVFILRQTVFVRITYKLLCSSSFKKINKFFVSAFSYTWVKNYCGRGKSFFKMRKFNCNLKCTAVYTLVWCFEKINSLELLSYVVCTHNVCIITS